MGHVIIIFIVFGAAELLQKDRFTSGAVASQNGS